MTSFSGANFFVFLSVAFAHATLIGGLSCLETASPAREEKLIFVEFISPIEPPPEPEELRQNVTPAHPEESASTPESTETVALEIPAAVLPPPPPTLPDYTLETAHDAASGKDGEVRGDGTDAAEKIAPAEQTPAVEVPTQETPAPEENLPKPTNNSDVGENEESGGEKIGKQGLREATREGEFGNNGAGGDSATATVRYKRRVAPKYPRADRIAGRTGTVILLLEIDASGRLQNLSIKQSSGFRSLDAAAVQAARASKYLPAHDGERYVPSRAEASYTFSR